MTINIEEIISEDKPNDIKWIIEGVIIFLFVIIVLDYIYKIKTKPI